MLSVLLTMPTKVGAINGPSLQNQSKAFPETAVNWTLNVFLVLANVEI